MKRLKVISVVVVVLFCLGAAGAWADGQYVFRSDPGTRRDGYDCTVALDCRDGRYVPFVKVYNGGTDPVGNEMVQSYISELIAHPMNGVQCYEEYEPLEGTWRGFRIHMDTGGGSFYIFKSYPEIREDGLGYSVCMACKGGYYAPFVKGYENNPNPINHRGIQEYVKVLNKHPMYEVRCYAEHQVLEGTWRGFYTTEEESGDGGGGCFITTAGIGM